MNAVTNMGSRAVAGTRLILLSLGLLILRLGMGGLLAYGHGWDKLVNFNEMAGKFGDPIGLGPTPSLVLVVFAEFFCSILLMLGLLTRLATVPLIINMSVAAFIVHAADPFAKKELALLYLVPFVALLFTGPGRYSLDAVLWPRLWRRRERD